MRRPVPLPRGGKPAPVNTGAQDPENPRHGPRMSATARRRESPWCVSSPSSVAFGSRPPSRPAAGARAPVGAVPFAAARAAQPGQIPQLAFVVRRVPVLLPGRFVHRRLPVPVPCLRVRLPAPAALAALPVCAVPSATTVHARAGRAVALACAGNASGERTPAGVAQFDQCFARILSAADAQPADRGLALSSAASLAPSVRFRCCAWIAHGRAHRPEPV